MYTRCTIEDLPKLSFFLFGPRQVGKSTLLATIDAHLLIDLLVPTDQLAFIKTPGLLADQVAALPDDATVIIDEIQKAPALLDVIHSLMVKRPSIRFIMSGSSARKLKRGAANLLGGRALYRTMHPLTQEELKETFQLETVLAFGSLPRIWTTVCAGDVELGQELLRAYVITYLREEIAAEALVRNLQGFQNFLDVAGAQFAQQVNMSGVARDCHVALATVRDYYSILEDTLMGFFLRPYEKSTRKRMSLQPRFYFFDNGVTRALLGKIGGNPSPLERGRLYEQWFIQEVYRLNEYKKKDWKLYFYRTSHGAEVDLLIERGGSLLAAIECKHKQTLARADLNGLRSLRTTYPDVPCYLTAPVKTKQMLDFAHVLPPVEMLKKLSEM